MIGSVAPICTYNECRGCKYKCRAEQVPVEGNDPMNSAYHYKSRTGYFQISRLGYLQNPKMISSGPIKIWHVEITKIHAFSVSM
ncbi:hypothetical protein LguiB_000533 [Lonicera macranthoides]